MWPKNYGNFTQFRKKPLMTHKAVVNPASVLITVIFVITANCRKTSQKKKKKGSVQELSSLAWDLLICSWWLAACWPVQALSWPWWTPKGRQRVLWSSGAVYWGLAVHKGCWYKGVTVTKLERGCRSWGWGYARGKPCGTWQWEGGVNLQETIARLVVLS